jgi:hypothetical protein
MFQIALEALHLCLMTLDELKRCAQLQLGTNPAKLLGYHNASVAVRTAWMYRVALKWCTNCDT